MPNDDNSIEALEAQISAITNTNNNLRGLIEKIARIQSDLSSAGFDEASEAVGDPFSGLSSASDRLQEIAHDLEIERNRRGAE